ncbi:putative E3 ubiquitin-protein ligase [Nowakowskiella sp. JEL0407]|nr:putative E3 ubiquitin-protein ligase [Nowakowskiella sp. JEL0407]
MHVNDLKPVPKPPQDQFTMSLTLPGLEIMFDEAAQDPSKYDALQKVIASCFGHFVTLNESYGNDTEPTLTSPGLSLEDVRKAYHLILRRDTGHRLTGQMMLSIEKLLRRPGRFPLPIFQRRVDLVNHFITYRLTKKDGMRDHYPADWGIRSAARIMALLFAANQERKERLAVSDFYNTVVDYFDLIRDYMRWQEERSGSFSLCQYPFLISLGGKMQIMEADAKRQMAERFKEAFFRTAMSGMVTDPFLSLFVNRASIIQDSLTQLSVKDIDFKKRLRIEFTNEDGVDAGGLTKEWFLLLVRDLFDPQYGMFVFDEESHYCWFNHISFENHDEYRLVGIIIGLAIYNSMILDVHFPLAVYKKLLRHPANSLEDLRILKPSLANGLQKLLEYENDDVEGVFGLDFVAEYEAYGSIMQAPLVDNGESIPVTSLNKKSYVDAYVNWVLNESVKKQFDAFSEGFNHVCGGNALSLFRPEEIEMMVRGGTELDLKGLESVTEYDGFDPQEPTVRQFWDIFAEYSVEMQRKLLLFVTGTDRIPATGIQNMAFKLSCMGADSEKLPISHTCFNQLYLYRYSSKEKLREKLNVAINWSGGFGLK